MAWVGFIFKPSIIKPLGQKLSKPGETVAKWWRFSACNERTGWGKIRVYGSWAEQHMKATPRGTFTFAQRQVSQIHSSYDAVVRPLNVLLDKQSAYEHRY